MGNPASYRAEAKRLREESVSGIAESTIQAILTRLIGGNWPGWVSVGIDALFRGEKARVAQFMDRVADLMEMGYKEEEAVRQTAREMD